ncbi:hypothetical protein IRT38_00770 (plasmid) [Acinetobacter sp. SK-43]|uniref:hypothetical protein n=1 Tax=Acinetobacter sp. SK-43 TaxID=2785295 RepID=UPI00188C8E77|nr:hypothetical protein [Acinetobacter sp. SK-43]MBF4453948.1 hypothetical protein [Acinetobacter sp. SK-43]
MNPKKFFACISLPIILLAGCGQKQNEATIFKSTDYAVLDELKQSLSQEYSFREYVDETLGFKKFTFMTFVGDNSPYTQIALECIHEGALKIKPKESQYDLERFEKNKELSTCIQVVVDRPVSIDTILYNDILGLNSVDKDQTLKNLITEAKKDNILTIREYLRIGILTYQKYKEENQKRNKPVETTNIDKAMDKLTPYISDQAKDSINTIVNEKE